MIVMDKVHGIISPQNKSLAITKSKYKKGLIKKGLYSHPVDDWEMNVDQELMQEWVDNFAEMKSNGVKIPVTKTHDNHNPDNLLGYADELFIEDDWLYAIVTLHGDASAELAERVGQVSIGVDHDFKDGKGNSYGDAIEHIAVVNSPVVPGQSDFEPYTENTQRIAAGRYAMLSLVSNKRKQNSMLNKEQKQRFALSLNKTVEEVTDETIVELVEAQSLQLREATKELSTAKTKIANYDASTIPLNDPSIVEERAELLEEGFDSLVTSGTVSQETVNELKLSLLGTKGNRNKITLSTGGAVTTAIAKQVLAILKKQAPRVEFGSKTGSQTAILDDKGRAGKEGMDKQQLALWASTMKLNDKQKSKVLGANN
jgi:hypothetical protein